MKERRMTLLLYEAPLAETITIRIEKSILSGNDIEPSPGIQGPNLSRRRREDDDFDYDY